MSEEAKIDVPVNTETTETVSEEVIQEVNAEIEKVEGEKLEAAKEAGKAELSDDLEVMKKTLEELKAKNDAAEAARKAEEEKAKLLADLAAEKARAEAPVKKHVVPQDPNPVRAEAPVAAPAPKLSPEQEWHEFEKNFGSVSVSAKKE